MIVIGWNDWRGVHMLHTTTWKQNRILIIGYVIDALNENTVTDSFIHRELEIPYLIGSNNALAFDFEITRPNRSMVCLVAPDTNSAFVLEQYRKRWNCDPVLPKEFGLDVQAQL